MPQENGRERIPPAIAEALLQLSRSLAGFRSLDELARQLPAALREAAPYDHLGLVLHDRDRRMMRYALVFPDVPLPFREAPDDFGIAGVIEDVARTARRRAARLREPFAL